MTATNAPSYQATLSAEQKAHETSMDDILASIRRIISDDDAIPLSRGARAAKSERIPAPPPAAAPEAPSPAPASGDAFFGLGQRLGRESAPVAQMPASEPRVAFVAPLPRPSPVAASSVVAPSVVPPSIVAAPAPPPAAVTVPAPVAPPVAAPPALRATALKLREFALKNFAARQSPPREEAPSHVAPPVVEAVATSERAAPVEAEAPPPVSPEGAAVAEPAAAVVEPVQAIAEPPVPGAEQPKASVVSLAPRIASFADSRLKLAALTLRTPSFVAPPSPEVPAAEDAPPPAEEPVMLTPVMQAPSAPDLLAAVAPEPVQTPEPERAPAPTRAAVRPAAPASVPAEAEESALLSPLSGAKIGASFEALAETMMLRDPDLVERVAREMLRPMLKSWLDDNLPIVVERLVRAEIERVARGRPA